MPAPTRCGRILACFGPLPDCVDAGVCIAPTCVRLEHGRGRLIGRRGRPCLPCTRAQAGVHVAGFSFGAEQENVGCQTVAGGLTGEGFHPAMPVGKASITTGVADARRIGEELASSAPVLDIPGAASAATSAPEPRQGSPVVAMRLTMAASTIPARSGQSQQHSPQGWHSASGYGGATSGLAGL